MGNLVLTRKKGEGITLDFGSVKVQVTIVEISGGPLGRVKLSFTGPPEKVDIYRNEVFEKQQPPKKKGE